MKICITGGHSELLWDMIQLFSAIGHSITVIGGMPDRKRPALADISVYREAHERIEQAIQAYIKIHGYNPPIMIAGNRGCPSLHHFCIDSGVEDDIKRVALNVDVFYGYAPQYVAVYHPYRPMIWHLVSGENVTYQKGIEAIISSGGRVVCYAEAQSDLFHGQYPVIHFGKRADDFYGWTGEEESVLYVANSLHERAQACHESVFFNTRRESGWWLAGSHNERYGFYAKEYTYDDLKMQMRKSRLFFNLSTEPAPYTLALIEAAMTGMPIVTCAYQHQMPFPRYQVPELLGKGCVIIDGNRTEVENLIKRYRKCRKIGKAARESALKHFEWTMVRKQWEAFIANLF